MKKKEHIRLLLVEDNEEDAELFRRLLLRDKSSVIKMEWEPVLSAALKRPVAERFDVIVTDLGLPDSSGIDAFRALHARYQDTPVIVLTGLSDEDLALRAVQQGAQDYVVKGQADSSGLRKSIRYAIERQKLLTELRDKLSEIRKLERERKNILSMFAHDIRNAIVPAVGFLKWILSGKTKNLQEDLALIKDELITADHLLTNFIEFSRFETKEYRPSRAPFDIDAIIRQQIEGSRLKSEQKKIRVSYKHTGGSVPMINADSAMIRRVISNLLDNAIKYTDAEGSVQVRALNTEGEILIEVRDTGTGIDSDKLPYIFDAFYRATGRNHGSGLGLSIARTVVEAHGGRIWVESVRGEGSSFFFSVPKHPQKA